MNRCPTYTRKLESAKDRARRAAASNHEAVGVWPAPGVSAFTVLSESEAEQAGLSPESCLCLFTPDGKRWLFASLPD